MNQNCIDVPWENVSGDNLITEGEGMKKKNDETAKPLSWLAIFKNFFTHLRNASVDKPKPRTFSL